MQVVGVPSWGTPICKGCGPLHVALGDSLGAFRAWPNLQRHHFWASPVAQAVVDHPAPAIWRSVSCAEVWMVQAPEYVQQCVWDVVMMAVVFTVESGRWLMAKALKWAVAVAPGPALLEQAITHVVVGSWARLRSIAVLEHLQRGWALGYHPFLVVSGVLGC